MRRPRNKGMEMNQFIKTKVNRGEQIFRIFIFKQMFLQVLKEAKNKYKFRLKHFCIMSDFVHLLIRPFGGEDVSRIMQWVNGTFAIRYNKKQRIKGHFWGERFFNKIIKDSSYFNHIFDWISQNPVKAKIVKYAEEYIFSGLYFIFRGVFDLLDPGGFLT